MGESLDLIVCDIKKTTVFFDVLYLNLNDGYRNYEKKSYTFNS